MFSKVRILSDFSAEDLNLHSASVAFDTIAPALLDFLDNLGNTESRGDFDSKPVTLEEVCSAVGT